MTRFSELTSAGNLYRIIDLPAAGRGQLERLPYIHRVLLENVLRTGGAEAERASEAILAWLTTGSSEEEIPF